MSKYVYLLPIIISFIFSLALTPTAIFIYKKFGWIEDPAKTKRQQDTHSAPVPRGGGHPIFLSILFSSIIFLPLDQHLKGILAGAAIIWAMGLADDILDINPHLRLLGCLLAAGLVVSSGIGIAFVTNPLGGIIRLDQPQIHFYFAGEMRSIWVIADLLAIFWIVFLTNAVNWAKGFDGQLPGIVIIAALAIAAISLNYSADVAQWPVAILSFVVAGAYLGFLPFNFYPQKIMPGYGGGALAGYMLAVLSILSTAKIGTAIVVLGVPIIDAIYSITRRISSGKSPVWGDRGHLHHQILDKWHWGKRRTAIFYWGITLILGLLAINLNAQGKFYTIIMLATILGGLLLWLNYFSKSLNQLGPGRRSKISPSSHR